jgi:hypothetical protein
MVDDDGSGTTGTIINNAWKQELYGQIDGADAGVWTPMPFVAGNYYGSGGAWTLTAVNQEVLEYVTLAGAHTVVMTFRLGGTMTLLAPCVSLFIATPAPVFAAQSAAAFHYYLPGATGTGYVELAGSGTRLRLLRDASGNAFPAFTAAAGYIYGQIVYRY